MNILLVEDDIFAAEWIAIELRKEFEGATVRIIETESEFRKAFVGLEAQPPDLAVVDLMLPWGKVAADFEVEAALPSEGPLMAGLRCVEMLRESKFTRSVPLLLTSAMQKPSDIPSDVAFVQKTDESLIQAVRSVLSASGNQFVRASLALRTVPARSEAKKPRIFISYSHKDKRFLNDLLIHLKPLERAGLVTAWSDKQIAPGAKWFEEIKAALAAARVVVLLVSKDFLASDFIHEHELGPLLKEADRGCVRIMWAVVRACSYLESPLTKYQAMIPPDKPLAEMKAERDRAWVSICEHIKSAVQKLH